MDHSQIEIDAAYEGVCGLALFEAKCHLSDDFLIRQLYYPYRLWKDRVSKPVRSIFLIYSNSIYRLYEYAFQDMKNYNSLILKNQKNYSVEDTGIKITDIEAVLQPPRIVAEPEMPFPQADCFERVINICELLKKQELSRDDITERYAFDVRQTNYYIDAARYLGLLEKHKVENTIIYKLCKRGECIFRQNYKERQLALCALILSHKAFGNTLREYFKRGSMPSTEEIIRIIRLSNLYHINSDSTFERRAFTIKSWLDWVISLITV